MVKMPTGILTIEEVIVNVKTTICTNNTNFEEISTNDLLENIRILYDYILTKNRTKNKMKNNWPTKN